MAKHKLIRWEGVDSLGHWQAVSEEEVHRTIWLCLHKSLQQHGVYIRRLSGCFEGYLGRNSFIPKLSLTLHTWTQNVFLCRSNKMQASLSWNIRVITFIYSSTMVHLHFTYYKCKMYYIWRTFTLLDSFYFMLQYTSFLLHLRGRYCTFYSLLLFVAMVCNLIRSHKYCTFV